jgi:hypothetical protein
MRRTFTEDDVLLFIYNELSAEDRQSLKEELRANPVLMKYYQDTVKITGELDKISLEPDPTTVNILLEYSQNHLEETH